MPKLSIISPGAASRQRTAAPAVVFTDAERNRVLAHLDDMFLSLAFRNSKRYCTLLRYVVERALDGQANQLKERTIGVDAFGRQADYDTSTDHSVRSAAGEVRRRLAQYYIESGALSTVRIEMPPGSYVPQIRFLDASAPAEEPDAVSPAAVAVDPVAPAPEWSASRPRRFTAKAILAVSIAALLLIAVSVRANWRNPSPFDRFWNPILSSPSPALLCFGGGKVAEPAATLADLEHSSLRRMNVSDALSLVSITTTLRSKGKPYRILNRAGATSFQDLRQGPFILIGALNNEWSLRLTSGLRFTFARQGAAPNVSCYIADKRNPSNTSWSFSFNTPLAQSARDYAIVTRLRDPLTQQSGLIVAGISGWGTQAAGEFVSNPEELRKLESFTPARWEQKNLQVVIATDVIRGSSGPPVILAAHFW